MSEGYWVRIERKRLDHQNIASVCSSITTKRLEHSISQIPREVEKKVYAGLNLLILICLKIMNSGASNYYSCLLFIGKISIQLCTALNGIKTSEFLVIL